MKKIAAEHVSSEVMKGLGRAVRITPDLVPDAETDIQSYYGQLAVMESKEAVQIGICVAKNRAFVVDELEQHVQTSELLFAVKGDFVTPATTSKEVDGKLYPDMDKIAAVRVNQGEGVFFDKAVWHWTPFAITPTCDVLVVFEKETPGNDFTSVKLDENVEMVLDDAKD